MAHAMAHSMAYRNVAVVWAMANGMGQRSIAAFQDESGGDGGGRAWGPESDFAGTVQRQL